MDIKVTSTGKIFRRLDPALGGILCEALPSLFESVASGPQFEQPGAPTFKKPAAADWKVGRTPNDNILFLQLTTPVIGEVVRYTREPDGAVAFFERYYKHCPVPAAVLEAYKAEYERPGSTQPTRQEKLEAEAARMREFMAGREPSTSWLDGGKK